MATKWTVEIVVNDAWVEDGYDLADPQAQKDLAERLIEWADSWEVQCKTIRHETVDDLVAS